MPSPKPDESRDDFMARCVPIVLDDGSADDNEQAVAMCGSMYEGKDMSTNLLSRIKTRNAIRPPSAEFGYGITTADKYVQRALSECGTGLCKSVFQFPDERDLLKTAAQKLVYANADMVQEKAETGVAAMTKLLPDGIELPKHAALINVHVLTTPRVDRDKDILETSGAIVDPKMPSLWQHLHHLPVGKMLAIIEQSEKALKVASVLLDLNELTADMVKLIEANVLRFSHGFRALEFTEIKDQDEGDMMPPGFRVTRFEIMEESYVSVPSNVDAEMELYSANKLSSEFFKAHAKHYMDQRTVQAPGISLEKRLSQMLTDDFGVTPEEVKGLSAEQLSDLWEQKNEDAEDTSKATECKCRKTPILSPEEKSLLIERLKKEESESKNKRRYAPTKHFSVENEYLEAHKLEYEWVSRFIGCEVKELQVVETGCSPTMAGSFLSGCRATSSGWSLHDTRNITYEGKEKPPIHKVIQLNSRKSGTFLTIGMQFWKREDGCKLCVKFCENWNGGIECRTYSKNSEGWEFICKAWNWARENNFLKGEAFALTGDFLPKTSETFDDVFLDEKNKEPLQKLRKRINDNGKQLANRGLIFQGPPGTGKTLSARILRNECNTTFIWVSARDFYRIGAIDGICSALDMARDLAPSIVCLEDVDNWLSDYTVDVLKSELDGVARSTGVVTVLTTNYPERMPDTLIDRPGRFHDILEFHLPSKTIRKAMLLKWLVEDVTDEKFQASNKAIDSTAEKTDGYSGAHIYELCNYAKTIADEDELTLDDAVEKALTKIREQRELINQSQLAGSNYRPSHREAQEFAKKLPEGIKHIVSVDQNDGKVSITFESEIESPPEEADKSTMLDRRMAELSERDRSFVQSMFDQYDKSLASLNDKVAELELQLNKAGRTLSKKNLEKLIEVKDDLADLKGMDGMGRPHKALCERCIRMLGEVIDSASSGEEEEPKSITPREAAKILLAQADDELLKRVLELIKTHLSIKETYKQGKQYRKLVATK